MNGSMKSCVLMIDGEKIEVKNVEFEIPEDCHTIRFEINFTPEQVEELRRLLNYDQSETGR